MEALIDIQIENPGSIAVQDVERLSASLKNEFPTRLPLHHLQMGFQVNPSGDAEFSKDQQTLGYRLDRPGRVLQFRTTGFSYSHLPPYSNWDTFSAEAEKFWSMFTSEFRPTAANRIAVRMINRLPLPSGDIRLDSCLNVYPTLPDSLPSDTQSLFMQLQLPMKHVAAAAITILQIYSAMLDIDFIIQRSTPIGEVFRTLNVLGDAKDDIFEACITDKIRELIV